MVLDTIVDAKDNIIDSGSIDESIDDNNNDAITDPDSVIVNNVESLNEEGIQPRRVKLYQLSNDKWIDCGTGYCTGKLSPIPHFFVVSETDDTDILLNSPIQGSTQYQRQQDTLIVWTNDDGIDYALSFQEPEGCLELCKFLIDLQQDKNLAPNISLVAIIQTSEGESTEIIAGPIPELPIPTLNNLGSILDLLTINQFKNKIINQILENDGLWLINLIEIFENCEKNHYLLKLYCLSDIIKTLIYFNEIDIFEIFLINNKMLHGVIGILEYEPEFPGSKMNWRNFLIEKIKIKEVIKLNNEEIESEIRKCFILQFFKDVVLARLIDDSVFNCISTMIQNKESKIINFIQNDESFLNNLFKIYDDGDDDDDDEKNKSKKIDVIKLIHQYVLISKKMQPFQRSEFYKILILKGLNKMIQFSTIKEETESRILITEVIVTIIEHDVLLFKDFDDQMLMNTLINILINEKNLGLKTQSFEAIKLLIDPNNLIEATNLLEDPNNNNASNNANNFNGMNNLDLVDESFFSDFYDKSANRLFKPIIQITNDDNVIVKINREYLITLESLCELLSFISKFHDPIFSRSFILENHILKGVNKLINNKYKFQLRLSAIRCLRNIILLNDEFYMRYIIEFDILKEFMNIVKESNNQENLISSTCLNFLNIIYENLEISNFKLLSKYLASNYKEILGENIIGSKILQKESQDVDIKSESEAEGDDDYVNGIDEGEKEKEEEEEDKEEDSKTENIENEQDGQDESGNSGTIEKNSNSNSNSNPPTPSPSPTPTPTPIHSETLILSPSSPMVSITSSPCAVKRSIESMEEGSDSDTDGESPGRNKKILK